MILSANREEFAAARRAILEDNVGTLSRAVRQALEEYDKPEWDSPILKAAQAVFNRVAADEGVTDPALVAAARDDFVEILATHLAKTGEPTDPVDPHQVRLIAEWVTTASVNAATMAAAAADDEPLTLEWVTMHDGEVRASHRDADGQVVPVGATFDIDGHGLRYPGEPIGPPEVWINCRCVVRPGLEEDMTAALTAATAEVDEVDDDLDPDAPPISDDDLDLDVPFYGVAAPEGLPTGDRRKFNEGSLRTRDLPLPMRYQPADQPGHDGSIVVGRIDNIWRDEASSTMRYEGVFHRSSDAEKVIDLVANRMQRGVSVDLDDTTVEVQNDDGSAFDAEAWQMGDPEPLTVVTDGRIASISIVAIPAFQEAFISLGTWADDEAEPSDPGTLEDGFEEEFAADCVECDLAILAQQVPAEHLDYFASGEFGPFAEVGTTYQVPDGPTYVFDEDGLHVFTPKPGLSFAPGTKDGPGWITHPRATARIRRYWVHGKGAAKIRWGVPGDFNRCRKQLAKYVKNPDWLAGLCANMHKEAIKVWPGQEGGKRHSLEGDPAPAFTLVEPVVASAEVRPAAWFKDPGLTGPTPITVTEDGRVFGHLATWGTCHIGISGVCTTPPHSVTGYANFHTHSARTDEGKVPVGYITMGTGHASMRSKARAAAAHYDNTGTAAAEVVAGEDMFGIWVAGAAFPDLTKEEMATLEGAALSGDWRDFRGNLDLVAALCVNVPGFPIPRTALAASGQQQTALVASGIVVGEVSALSHDDLRDIVRDVLDEDRRRADRVNRALSARKTLNARRQAAALKALGR